MTGKFEVPHEVPGDEKEIADIPGAELLDNSLGGETERALERIEEVASRAEALAERDPEVRERAISLRDRAIKLGRQIKGAARIIGLSVSVMLAAAAADYELTRYNVSEHVDDHGKLIFEHQDQETTRILDYLSGKGELPEADRLILEVQRVRKMIGSNDSAAAKKLEDMNEGELSAVWDEREKEIYQGHAIPGIYPKGGLRAEIDSRYEYSQELYDVLWNIESEAGNPKICFRDFSVKDPFALSLNVNMDRAFYNPVTNTIYIPYPAYNPRFDKEDLSPPDLQVLDDFVAEASHGKQWEEAPITHDLRGLRDTAHVIVRAFQNKKGFNDTYKSTLYSMPGTVEYEAHKQIEPELKKELTHYEKTEQEEQERKSQEQHAAEGGWNDGQH